MEYKVIEKEVEKAQEAAQAEQTALLTAEEDALEPAPEKKLPAKKEKKPSRLKRFVKKLSVGKVILAVIAIALVGYFAINALTPKQVEVIRHRVAPLLAQDLRNPLDVTGNIESEESSRVYSTLTASITEVAVEVGDHVEKGQLLCQLDTASIEADIKANEAGIGSSGSNNSLTISQAQDDLDTARAYYESGRDEGILAAQSSLESAQRSRASAEYDLQQAQRELRAARQDNRDAKDDGEDPVHDTDAIAALNDAVAKAEIQIASANAAIADAEEKLQRAEETALVELRRLEEAVTRARNSANQTADYISLDSLKEDLEKCTVTAPSSGTVTAVYAEEGDAGNKLLFVIEDPDALIVECTVMEYDVNNVRVGQKAEIKSDATGDRVFAGEVLSISPTSVKGSDGQTVTGSTASFSMEIRITDKDPGLRIGMNVRASIITEEKPGALAVLYDAVGQHPETGETVVYVAEPAPTAEISQEEPQMPAYIARMVPVTTGMETDLHWEIFSDQLSEGALILQEPEGLSDGMEIHIDDSNASYSMGGLGATPGGMGGGRAVRIGG